MALSPGQKPRPVSSSESEYDNSSPQDARVQSRTSDIRGSDTRANGTRGTDMDNRSPSMMIYIIGALAVLAGLYYFYSSYNNTSMRSPNVSQQTPAGSTSNGTTNSTSSGASTQPMTSTGTDSQSTTSTGAGTQSGTTSGTSSPPAADPVTPPVADPVTPPVAPATPPASTTTP